MTFTSTVSLISESNFLLSVTCSGLSADSLALYLALESARLLRLDKEVTEALIESITSSDKLRLTYIHINYVFLIEINSNRLHTLIDVVIIVREYIQSLYSSH